MGDYDGKRILVVEDNEINLQIVQNLLVSKKALVDVAENGKVACEMFEQSPIGYYAVILMDVRMPVMDGYRATQYIRSLPRDDAKRVRIIALSANAFEEDRRKSIAVGMDDHISKPIDKQELFNSIKEN